MIDRVHPQRQSLIRQFADQALKDPAVTAALLSGGLPAAAPVLAGVMERLVRCEVERRGVDYLRVSGRGMPDHERQLRDHRLRALMASGTSPAFAALEVGCSRAHAYRVQAAMRRQSQAAP